MGSKSRRRRERERHERVRREREEKKTRAREMYENAHEARDAVLEALRSDERIASARYEYPDHLHLETRSLYADVRGHRLFIGRVRLVFGAPPKDYLQIEWLESGARARGRHLYSVAKNHFCFGDRSALIIKMIGAKEHLAAAYVALESLEHINEPDEKQALAGYEHALDCPCKMRGERSWFARLLQR